MSSSVVIPAVGSVLGGGISALGASSAASDQGDAAAAANALQYNMFDQLQANLQPYMISGGAANTALQNQLGINNGGTGNFAPGSLLGGPSMTESQLQQTPGYQFNLNQGLNAVQNSAAAQGLGTSGNALAGAATYATGLADSTYQNQFNNAVTNQTNQFNRLLSLTQLGQSSAAGVGTAGLQTASNIGNNLIGAANAQGAATIAGTNALSQGLATAGYYGALSNGLYGNNANNGSYYSGTGETINNNAFPNATGEGLNGMTF